MFPQHGKTRSYEISIATGPSTKNTLKLIFAMAIIASKKPSWHIFPWKTQHIYQFNTIKSLDNKTKAVKHVIYHAKLCVTDLT